MSVVLTQGHVVFQKITGWLNQLTNQPTSAKQPEPLNDLYQDMYQIEKALNRMCTKPLRATTRDTRPLTPVTERHRIMDLAG